MNDRVLVGDVGGTSVRFALARRHNGNVSIEQFVKFAGDGFNSLEDAIAAYLEPIAERPGAALIALAGPISNGVAQLTNRDWPPVSAEALAQKFGFSSTYLVNDFAAMARSVPELPAQAFEEICAGEPVTDAPFLVAGAGTGLGVATLLQDAAGGWRVVSGEGGHAAYVARTDQEIALVKYLERAAAYVSNERICSGIAFPAVHRALCEIAGRTYEEKLPQDVFQDAQNGDAISADVCRIRARAIMAAAGDAALINGTWRGVVLAGGVTQRLLPYLIEPESLARFHDRGPHTALMSQLPVKLIALEEAPLIGAATLYFER